jgi:hypothetical protein
MNKGRDLSKTKEKAGAGLIQVMVDVHSTSGIYRAIRWESPEDAQRIIKDLTSRAKKAYLSWKRGGV